MFIKRYYILIIISCYLYSNPNTPEGFEFIQSQKQAFYIFELAVINADTLNGEGGHWIGAFHTFDETKEGECEIISQDCPDVNNDQILTVDAEFCVGSSPWDELSYISLPVMGADDSIMVGNQILCQQTGTCHYLQPGDYPTFKIYDVSLDSSLNAIPSSDEAFTDLGVYFIDLLEHESYLDYNSIPLYEGNNLISFWALPWENSVEDIFGEMENIISVSSEGLIANYVNGDWYGNLQTIDRQSGYWVIVDDDEVLNVFGIATDSDIEYNLEENKSLISFPSPVQTSITNAIPDIVENSFYGIIGEGSAAQRIGSNWEGSLTFFEGTNGYWALINEPVNFNFIIDESRVSILNQESANTLIPEQFSYNLSMNQAFYFVHSIVLDNQLLETSKIILTYCNENIVGYREWNNKVIDQPAMGFDGTDRTSGYCYEGEIPEFKLYDNNSKTMVDLHTSQQYQWSNNSIYNINLYGNTEIVLNPIDFSINTVFPNPFNGSISINYLINTPGNYSIEIIDINGKSIDIIHQNFFHDKGNYISVWDSGINSSGTYFVKITDFLNKQNIVQKLMLIK